MRHVWPGLSDMGWDDEREPVAVDGLMVDWAPWEAEVLLWGADGSELVVTAPWPVGFALPGE